VVRRASEFFPEESILVSTLNGIELGRGRKLDEIVAGMSEVAEGVAPPARRSSSPADTG
jgi:hypothetical protein